MNITKKIISKHLVEGQMEKGTEIGIKVDQTLTQDLQGPVSFLQLEAMGVLQVKTKLSVSYVDHNLLQTTCQNAEDHRFLQTVAAKYGGVFSRPGNGICHQVHLERFGVPLQTLVGTDSHTPTCGALGMLAIGAGAMEVACAMGGGPFYMEFPNIVGVELRGKLSPWVSAKDVILELLRRMTVKWGKGRILEYYGEGVASLSVPERATISNMGAELGVTTSIFPSDSRTKEYLSMQKRETDFVDLTAETYDYDEKQVIDMNKIKPLVAKPSSPDNVCEVKKIKGTKVDQILIGSCTNSSFKDLATVAAILKDKHIHSTVSVAIVPGSRQVLQMLTADGSLAALIGAGARILQPACGPCIGLGETPATGTISLRTFNRNFEGRSGTKEDKVYLVSPEVAAVAAITGEIVDPRDFGPYPAVQMPQNFLIDDSMLLYPPPSGTDVKIIRGPNIKPLPTRGSLEDCVEGEVLLKLGDNVTTDDILPGGPKILSLRSNIPASAEYLFENVDPEFVARVKLKGGGFIVAGENYGQGSSREHAASCLLVVGVKAVIAKSFARIHYSNLINYGIVPLIFANSENYAHIRQSDCLSLGGLHSFLGDTKATELNNVTQNLGINVRHYFSHRQSQILLEGGLLNYMKVKVAVT